MRIAEALTLLWAASCPAYPLSYRVAARMPDVVEAVSPAQVRLGGYLGARVANSARNRLGQVDLGPLLAGFRQRPGSHPWIGEHIGKWLHAATLAWAYTDDSRLRAKIDGAVRELIRTQEPDGYLGTYAPDRRFGLYPGSDWDVWSHKYNLIGLLTYYHYTGSPEALAACRKMADLLMATFGPGKRSILAAGTHVGMAATSVLEPIVLLYRHTGDRRYLDFAKYIVDSWEEPNGPRVLTTLTTLKAVNRTANGKAYEMLSNLVGLCELARATGDRKYLVPALHAWEDIVAHHLYLTGTMSQGEHFHAPHDLPNHPRANIGETCVTVTWIQLNSQLLRLTGEAKYGNELERACYNHLAAAQRPDGAEWCYYTALEGAKPYGPGINCCVSSGPRGMALIPTMAYLKGKMGRSDALVVNLFEPSRAKLTLGGQRVTVTQKSALPRSGFAILAFALDRPATFGVKVRAPEWARKISAQAGSHKTARVKNGWVVIPPREWKEGDRIVLRLTFGPRMVRGQHSNRNRAALTWGPFVMAYDDALNPGLPPAPALVFASDIGTARLRGEVNKRTAAYARLVVLARVGTGDPSGVKTAVFVPFAEAGRNGSRYRIWLGAPGTRSPVQVSLLYGGQESRSREGNVEGSIADGDTDTFVVTYDGGRRDEDWFAVALSRPVAITRVVYAHGSTFHDGGWFDARAGKPRIEIQRTVGGPWETLGVLTGYPETTATDPQGLRGGETFTLALKAPVTVVAARVIGRPAHGDRPEQRFASCAELQAFEK